jgi:hypothetical protein
MFVCFDCSSTKVCAIVDALEPLFEGTNFDFTMYLCHKCLMKRIKIMKAAGHVKVV